MQQRRQGSGRRPRVARTSSAILDAFVERSWRSNAERQRAKGAEFVIGRRDGVYIWNVEGSHRVIDCGTAGGVHSLGHRHPEVLAALRSALDRGSDTGLWSVPNPDYLELQDRLHALAPSPALDRSVITLCSTLSVELAMMFAFRVTGRQRILAYRHGYHGHTGFAAQVTGSPDEGVIEHYSLPSLARFFETYGDLDELDALLRDDIAAIILEPIDYESFVPATREYLDGLARLASDRGALLVIDETRTGLGRTGRLWASEHYDLAPDMLVTGKGLSGGLYPVSALLTREDIYERCMNEHPYAYISSLGGNEISCVVASKVLEVSSRPWLAENVDRVSAYFAACLREFAGHHTGHFGEVSHFGCILALTVPDRAFAQALYGALFRHGVLCHSIAETEPAAIKFLPPLVITNEQVDEVMQALRAAVAELWR